MSPCLSSTSWYRHCRYDPAVLRDLPSTLSRHYEFVRRAEGPPVHQACRCRRGRRARRGRALSHCKIMCASATSSASLSPMAWASSKPLVMNYCIKLEERNYSCVPQPNNKHLAKNANCRQPNTKVAFLLPCRKRQCGQPNGVQNMAQVQFPLTQSLPGQNWKTRKSVRANKQAPNACQISTHDPRHLPPSACTSDMVVISYTRMTMT
jgi:hypothetical protein